MIRPAGKGVCTSQKNYPQADVAAIALEYSTHSYLISHSAAAAGLLFSLGTRNHQ